MRRTASLLLAMILVTALASTVLAQETPPIPVNWNGGGEIEAGAGGSSEGSSGEENTVEGGGWNSGWAIPGSPGQSIPPPPGGTSNPLPSPAWATGGPGEICYCCVTWPDCSSGYADLCTIELDGGQQWIHNWGCASKEACEGTPPSEGGSEEPPCIPGVNGPFLELACSEDRNTGYNWGWAIQVVARVPPHVVEVIPFPRWLVAMGAPIAGPFESGSAGRLVLRDLPNYTQSGGPNGPGGEGGWWSGTASFPYPVRPVEQRTPGDMEDFQMGLRWRRTRPDRPHPLDIGPVSPPCWTFDERPWNIGADHGYGPIPDRLCGPMTVSHIYETASYGKPANGPRFRPPEEVCGSANAGCCEQVSTWDMPAYQVRVPTTWSAEWSTRWDAWEQVGIDWSEPQCFNEEPTDSLREPTPPPPGICIGEGQWYGKIGEPQYDWVHHDSGWHTLDLRDYGNSTWYYTSYAVVTVGNGAWCNSEYADPNPGDTVRVPVIEAQSVLSDPCVMDGRCPPGYP